MEKVRAKFNVAEITKYGNAGGGKVILVPVMGNSEAMAAFDFGEYYLDFTKVE